MAEAQMNPLSMSDEDIEKSLIDNVVSSEESNESEEEEEVTSDATNEEEESSEEDQEEDTSDSTGDDESEEESEETSEEEAEESVEETEESEDTTENTDKVDDSEEINYKAQYEELFKPFKANGREMQVDSVDDARTLMQMGANYNKKMAALKPNLRYMKMLENNGLLDEDQLSFLIDVSKKDPAAIKKLMTEANIEPLDIEDVDANSYVKKNYSVSEKEVEIDEILSELKDTPSFQRTLSVLGNEWDAESKAIIADNPSVIKQINEHIESGIFDKVSTVVEREKMLGRLNGLSDIEAYKQIGETINAQGGFASLNEQTQKNLSGISPTSVDRVKNKVDPKVVDRKKAAVSTKATSRKKSASDFNPLSMSDEEFENMTLDKYV